MVNNTSIERITEEWGDPRYQEREFDPEHAVSHRTWLAIDNFVAYHEPRHLDLLFLGMEFPQMTLNSEAELNLVKFPSVIENSMSAETQRKYAHLALNPRLYGSMQTRLQLFQNLVQAMGPTANFLVGRNIRVNKDIEALKNGFIKTGESFGIGIQKALAKAFGVNPATVMQKRVPDANRALNKFLETEIVTVGRDFMDLRVEYLRPKDVSCEGDHYTVGVVLGGLEAIGAYKAIEIRALQSPLSEADEQLKASMKNPGVQYVYEGYVHRKNSPVFLYRYTFQERMSLPRRLGRAFADLLGSRRPSVKKKRELQDSDSVRLLMAQESELDNRALTEATARAEAAEARASAAEAKLTLEEQVSDVNRVFGDIRTLAHDDKNYMLQLRTETIDLFRLLLSNHSGYNVGTDDIFQTHETLSSAVDKIIDDPGAPPLVRSGAEYTKRMLEKTNIIIENERAIMAGGIPIHIAPFLYTVLVPPVIDALQKIHPKVKIVYDSHVDLMAQGDLRLLRAAYTNLISNAVEASLPDGRVEVTVDQKRRGGRTFMMIDIIQSGPLTPEIVDKLNQGIKFTTKPDGNKIGAAASYDIIKGPHDGSINYVSLGEDGGRIETRF